MTSYRTAGTARENLNELAACMLRGGSNAVVSVPVTHWDYTADYAVVRAGKVDVHANASFIDVSEMEWYYRSELACTTRDGSHVIVNRA